MNSAYMASRRWWVCATLLGGAILTAMLYWPGLSGPFVFDDFWNLRPVEQWLTGKQSFLSTLLPNDSWLLSRPVSMASFMASAEIGGTGSFSFKSGNLALHLATGLFAWWVMRLALKEDLRLAPHAPLVAAALAVIWLLHPLHVSTVLYAVQRMAQISALFALAAVGCYLVARRDLIEGRRRRGHVLLFLAFPILTAVGVLGKQNAAVAPLMCLALELAYFTQYKEGRGAVASFFTAFILLPVLGIGFLLVAMPGTLLSGYANWDFTATERLLTQPRVLIDYIGMLLVPRGPLMGLYTDDFPISTGLLSPASTAWAIAALVLVSMGAVALRRLAPTIFAGWFFFLAAHSLESSFLPLETYYEHRNYLPSVGLLLALSGLVSLLAYRKNDSGKLGAGHALVTASVLLVLAFSTFSRVLVWQDEESMIAQGLRTHPESIRVHLDSTALALRKQDFSAAKNALKPLVLSDDPRKRLVGRMDRISVVCSSGGHPDSDALMEAVSEARPILTVAEVHAVKLLNANLREGNCPELAAPAADSFRHLLDAADRQPESASNKYGIRLLTAEAYARAGRWQEAEAQARIGWQASGNIPTGILLARLYFRNGKAAAAERLLETLGTRIRWYDRQGQAEIVELRRIGERIAGRKASGGEAPGRARPGISWR